MTSTMKNLYRNTMPTSSTTLYTVPASTTAVITDIHISVTSGSPVVTLVIDGVDLVPGTTMASDAALTSPKVLTTGKIISGLATVAGVAVLSINGLEIT